MLLLFLTTSVEASPQSKANYATARQRSSTALSLALFLFLLSVYLLTYSPRFHSSDGLAVFATAESVVRRGEWDADQVRWMGLGQGILGVDGHLYTRKGVGQSLLALPLVWLGLMIPIWGTATTALLFNSIVTAATAVLLFHYLRALDYDDEGALVAALTFGLATLAWPYAKTFFSDPLAALCLLAAALALLRFRQTGRARHTLWAGTALALAVTARYANAALIPLFALFLLLYQIANLSTEKSALSPSLGTLPPRGPALPGSRGMGEGQPSAPYLQSPISNLFSRHWRAWLAFAAPLALAAAALVYYNLVRYGDPFNTGYLPEESFSGDWLQGVAGLLVSPGRGLFLYAPVLLLALPAFPLFFRRHRREAALAGGVILAHLLLYGKWFMWHGGYAWGPRFMVPTLPFFVLVLAPLIQRTRESRRWQLAFLGLAILSSLIQVLGLAVHFELFQNRLLDTGLPLFDPITFFAPRYSPLIGQFQFLRPEHLDFAWITARRINWPLLAVLLVGVLLSGWSLLRVGRLEGWKTGRLDGRALANSPTYQSTNLPIYQSTNLPACLVLLALTVWLLAYAHKLPPDDLRATVQVLNQRTTAADAIVVGTPEESVSLADLYKGHADVLGLADGPSLDADTTAVLSETAGRHPRVWWLPNWLPPAQSPLEMWMMRIGFRVEDRFIGERRLAMYYFPPQPLTERSIGDKFGEAIRLEEVSTLSSAHPGGALPVLLHWRASQPVPANYHVFVHLLDAQGNRVAQSDGEPAVWTRPTSSWRPGELIEDRHGLALPADLRPGDYTLVAGLYLPDSGERLATITGDTFILLSLVHIVNKI